MSYANDLRRENRIFQDELRNELGNEIGALTERLRTLENRLAALPLPAPEPEPPSSAALGPNRDLTKAVEYIDNQGMRRVLLPGQYLQQAGGPPAAKTTLTDLELRCVLREAGARPVTGRDVVRHGKLPPEFRELPTSAKFYRKFVAAFRRCCPDGGDPVATLRSLGWRGEPPLEAGS